MVIRPTHGLRQRLARKNQAPRMARSIGLDKNGLVIDGIPFPYVIGTDVNVVQHSIELSEVTVTVLTNRFVVPTMLPVPAHLTISAPLI